MQPSDLPPEPPSGPDFPPAQGPRPESVGPPPSLERPPLPPVCKAIIGLCVGLFALDGVLSHGDTFRGALGPVFEQLALYGPFVQKGEVWRVLGCVFAHGGPLHVGFNMWAVWSLGAPLERALRSGRFLLLCLITALGAAAFSLLFNFKAVTVGASGMILGYGGTMLIILKREFRRGIVLWLAQVAVFSLIPGVSWAGHLGGFLFGLPVGLALRSGPRVFVRAAPLLLAIAVAVVLIAAHPERFGH